MSQMIDWFHKINLKKHMKDLQEHVCIFGNQIPKWKGIFISLLIKAVTNLIDLFSK